MSTASKRVHFAPQNTFYSPPATPSPTFSEISLPNSDGPLTPPTITAALPPTEHGTRIHTALAFLPGMPLPISWDVTTRPDTSLSFNPHLGFAPSHASHVLSEPATSPPLTSLTLLCDQLPYHITVNPGATLSASSPFLPLSRPLPSMSGEPGAVATPGMPYVSVHDVLTVLYATLRIPLAPSEYAKLPPVTQAALAKAYNARCSFIRDPRLQEEERRKGVKRVDFVIAAGRTRFAGLGATKKGRDIWVLNLG